MALLRCFRIDRLFLAARQYVFDNMGGNYIKFQIVNYNSLFDRFTLTSPFLFTLSSGADPATEIYKIPGKTWINMRRR
jgi:dynein heavy chain